MSPHEQPLKPGLILRETDSRRVREATRALQTPEIASWSTNSQIPDKAKKKADVVEPRQGFDHVGLLEIAPTSQE